MSGKFGRFIFGSLIVFLSSIAAFANSSLSSSEAVSAATAGAKSPNPAKRHITVAENAARSPAPLSTLSPTPTANPNAASLIVVAPVVVDPAAGPTTDPAPIASAIALLVAADGVVPRQATATDALTQREQPILSTVVDGTKGTIAFTLVPADPKTTPTKLSIPFAPPKFDPLSIAGAIAKLTSIVASNEPAPTPVPSATLPNHRYDLIILPDTNLNDGSDASSGSTAFTGSSYVESRMKIDFLQWKINAITANDYFKDLSSTDTMPTTFVGIVRKVCAIQPGVYILRYSIAYSETQQMFFGTQQGYATLDGVLYHCPGTSYWFASPSPSDVSANPTTSPHYFLGHYTFTIHRRNGTTNGKIFNEVILVLNAALNGLRGKFPYFYFLGSGPIIAGSFLQNPDSNAAVTQAVGESSRYITCAAFISIVSPLLAPSPAAGKSPAPEPVFTRDDRDRAPCPTAKALYDAYSLEYPNPQYEPTDAPIFSVRSAPQISPVPSTQPTPLSQLNIPK